MRGRSRFLGYGALLIGLMILLIAVHLYLAVVSTNSLLDWFYYDDAFYYFKVAQNIVAGRGVTFDGTGPTNGFHPLWMLLLLPLYAIARGDGVLALRGVVVLVGGLLTLGVWLFYREAKHHFGKVAPLLVLGGLLLTPNFYVTLVAGGMESTLCAVTLVALWAALAATLRTHRETDVRAVLGIGLAAAAAMLARLDNALVVAVVGLGLLYRWVRARLPWKHVLRLSLAFGLPGTLGVGAFLLWGELYVGTWFPISAQVKTWWGSLAETPYGRRAFRYRMLSFLAAFWENPISQWPEIWARSSAGWRQSLTSVLLFGALLLLGALAGYWLLRKRKLAWERLQTAALDIFLLGIAFHFVYLKFLSGMSPLRSWYWTAEYTSLALLLSWGLAEGARLVGGWFRRIPRLGGVLSAVFLLVLVWRFGGWVWRTFPLHNEQLHFYLHQARWVEAHTEPGSMLGATGAGALGYFVRDRRVLALDGLIGTPAYLQAWKDGNTLAYLQELGLEYVIGGFWVTKMEPYRHVFANRLQPIAKYRYDGHKADLYRFFPEE